MALFPIPQLVSHDTRFPNAVPLYGGPYLAGYTPNSALINAVPSASKSAADKATFDGVTATSADRSTGDLVGVPVRYQTEDHQSIVQPN
jgi:hypothetical protein